MGGYKRISRARKRDLQQPDEFLTWSARLLQTVAKFKNRIIWGAIAAVVVAAGIMGYNAYLNQREMKAYAGLGRLVETYQAERAPGSADEALERVRADMEALIGSHGSGTAGKMAKVLLAGYSYEAGKTEAAIDLFKQALQDFEPGSYYHAAILNGLGYAYEKSGDFKAALAQFERLTGEAGGFLKTDALYNSARMYGRLGEKDKRESALRKIVDDRPDYLYADLIASEVD
ncbi:MAG: tetratricopeptide repeat protein [Desulfobacterales bacterium]